MEYEIKDVQMAHNGKNKILWADAHMPVLREIRERFSKEKPLAEINIGACLHVTSETANLCRTFVEGGAKVALCASNPLSTSDDVAASLVSDFNVKVFAYRGEDTQSFYKHINCVLDIKPTVTLDDGADLVSTLHQKRRELHKQVLASLEETTTGVIRLKAMQRDNALIIPVIAVNDAKTKYLFDNRYGTGQSTLDGILRATNILFAGKNVVVCGYGWCGRGFALRARGLGAKVIICEVDAIKALEAAMDGYIVMPIAKAAEIGDIFVTLTGDKNVITIQHIQKMKNGAILANSGHFDVEVDIKGLEKISQKIEREIRPGVDRYVLKNGKDIYLLGEGRLVNLVCAEGHPAEVMDMSFATQALAVEWVVKRKERLPPGVYKVPEEVEQKVAHLKLKTMGIQIDELTEEQKTYLASWQEGT
jgi:adenosylhomocysteinase